MIPEYVVYQDPTGCLTAFRFSPFEVRDDSNPSGDGLSHLNRANSGGAATAGTRARFSTGDDYNHTYFQNKRVYALLRTIGGSIILLVGFSLHLYFPAF